MAQKGSENLVICLHCEVPMSKVINYQLLQCSSPLTVIILHLLRGNVYLL